MYLFMYLLLMLDFDVNNAHVSAAGSPSWLIGLADLDTKPAGLGKLGLASQAAIWLASCRIFSLQPFPLRDVISKLESRPKPALDPLQQQKNWAAGSLSHSRQSSYDLPAVDLVFVAKRPHSTIISPPAQFS